MKRSRVCLRVGPDPPAPLPTDPPRDGDRPGGHCPPQGRAPSPRPGHGGDKAAPRGCQGARGGPRAADWVHAPARGEDVWSRPLCPGPVRPHRGQPPGPSPAAARHAGAPPAQHGRGSQGCDLARASPSGRWEHPRLIGALPPTPADYERQLAETLVTMQQLRAECSSLHKQRSIVSARPLSLVPRPRSNQRDKPPGGGRAPVGPGPTDPLHPAARCPRQLPGLLGRAPSLHARGPRLGSLRASAQRADCRPSEDRLREIAPRYIVQASGNGCCWLA